MSVQTVVAWWLRIETDSTEDPPWTWDCWTINLPFEFRCRLMMFGWCRLSHRTVIPNYMVHPKISSKHGIIRTLFQISRLIQKYSSCSFKTGHHSKACHSLSFQ
ncbi:hypothetical protein AVEN_148970-1 [Araneus ventricosus]|uniref:Uncharacterized protein n=1 Tax=Araneus ventricosus TaxID=182803 RepID=A0A4Y2TGP9_ARAVE|nr:hypothetical protein AVEN_148970-1 [Araneus ventricosus]